MVSLGCTICRGCQLDTCHVGIATQIETVEQAQEHGLKKFTPQEVDSAAQSCARFFAAMGEEVKEVVAALGYDRAQDLVGRYDLLEQTAAHDRIDLASLITPLEEFSISSRSICQSPIRPRRAERRRAWLWRARSGCRQSRLRLRSPRWPVTSARGGRFTASSRVHRRERSGARYRAGRGDRPLADF